MTVKIEHRAYGPDSTPEEVQAIRERVRVHSGDILLYEELPVQSLFHLDLFDAKLRELTAGRTSYSLLIDLTPADPPNAAIRGRLRQLFGGLTGLRAAAIFTGRNFMLNIAAKFVLAGLGLKSFTVHRTREEAVQALTDGA